MSATFQSEGCLPFLLRVTWMTWGNAALFFSVVHVAEGDAPVLADLMVMLTAGFLVAVRYVDIRWCNGKTAEGEPATLAHLWRYAIAVLLIAAALWGIARMIASNGWI